MMAITATAARITEKQIEQTVPRTTVTARITTAVATASVPIVPSVTAVIAGVATATASVPAVPTVTTRIAAAAASVIEHTCGSTAASVRITYRAHSI